MIYYSRLQVCIYNLFLGGEPNKGGLWKIKHDNIKVELASSEIMPLFFVGGHSVNVNSTHILIVDDHKGMINTLISNDFTTSIAVPAMVRPMALH